MKQYDSIQYYGDYWGIPVIAFDKLDGSNLRFEFSKKRGFYKFGTRNMIIDRNHEDFGFAVDIFINKYQEGLSEVFKSKTYRDVLSFVCFAELVGEKSEFGRHFKDDKFDIVLFDVDMYKKGFVPPRQFVSDFKHLGIPRIVYDGNLNKEFVQRVKNNEFNLSEGVICKSVVPKSKRVDNIYYCKIKADSWFERLRNKNPQLYKEEIKQMNIR